MSAAIDTTFHWVRNPTAINGLATTYVSKRGSDTTGDGTAQNPYASLYKATTMASSNSNIMCDDGQWSEDVDSTKYSIHFWGNSNTEFYYPSSQPFNLRSNNSFYFYHILFRSNYATYSSSNTRFLNFINSIVVNVNYYNYESIRSENSILIRVKLEWSSQSTHKHSILFNCASQESRRVSLQNCISNTAFSGELFLEDTFYNNYLSNNIPAVAQHSINNASTGQTLADYFNYVHPNVLANPSTAFIEDFLQCDFTAKAGSANVGAGEKGTTIGLNQGFTMYADNSANDVFKESNGATLKNIAWDSTLNGYILVQKEKICQGATANTITLDSSASAVDDYYNNLFIGIVGESVLGGGGYGEFYRIIDYDGATKTATIDGTWNVIPNTESVYTISGTILSAVKDLEKAIKVKRNWTFADNFTALTDGQWAEFLTNVETNGKQFPASCYSYEYSTDGVNFVQGQTADDLVSATNGENKVLDNIYGDCSANYNEATAKNLVMRYIRVRVHIGFNI